jgi:hypothetical protein
LKFENVTIHDISGRGIGGNVIVGYYDEANTPGDGYYDEDSTYFINCDIYNLCDSTSANPGNAADGIKVTLNGRTSHDVPHSYWHLQGCRFWNFSDDGTDIGGPGQVVHENCWSSSTNLFAPLGIEGNGFKSGGITWTDSDSLINKHWRIFKNCMAVDCEGEGFYDLDYISYFRTNGLFVNNIAYDNLVGFTAKTSYSFRPRTTKYFNNIAYSNNKFENNTYVEVEIGSGTAWEYTEHHNTWDNNNPSPASWPYFVMTDTVTITNDDFQSVDVSQLFEARKSDGSLPDITAFRLATGSDLIGAGTNVGMSATPDIGIDWSYLDSLNPPVRRKAAVVNGKFAKSIRGNLLIFNQ